MHWLSIDPGEDTGWALWEDGRLVEAGTDKLWDVIDSLCGTTRVAPQMMVNEDLVEWPEIGLIVMEDWALYPWKLKSLGWDKCHTARGIGAIELIGRISGIQVVLQPAAIKKDAVAAGAEELFLTPLHENRHCNDAIMHGTFYMARNGTPE
jgi:hypothetical protein